MNLEQLKEAQELADQMHGLQRQIDRISYARESTSVVDISILGDKEISSDPKRGHRQEITKIRSPGLVDKIMASMILLMDAELMNVQNQLTALGVKV